MTWPTSAACSSRAAWSSSTITRLPAVAKAAAFWTANAGWRIEEESRADPTHGWAVLRTADPPVKRNYDHFIWF